MRQSRRALAIVNPASGNVPLWRVKRVLNRAAARYGVDLSIQFTEYADHATELVSQAIGHFDMVLVVGGDGTVAEAVAAAVGTDLKIGIVPTGSTNMVAKDLGIPGQLGAAVRVAFTSATTIELDVAKAGAHTFMHMAGAGYDAEIMRSASRRWKRLLRWVAYLIPGIAKLRSKPFRVAIDIDGVTSTWHARMVLLALGGSIVHPRFVVGNGIDRTDGIIDVCVFNPPSLLAILATFGWIVLRRPSRSKWQHQLRGRRITLRSDAQVPFEFDGSYRGDELPVTVEILDQGVTVIVPSVPTPGELAAHLNPRSSAGAGVDEQKVTAMEALSVGAGSSSS